MTSKFDVICQNDVGCENDLRIDIFSQNLAILMIFLAIILTSQVPIDHMKTAWLHLTIQLGKIGLKED